MINNLGVNVFGLWKLISDETFCTQSQIRVEKFPEFSAESLCLRQGMVTSGCDKQ